MKDHVKMITNLLGKTAKVKAARFIVQRWRISVFSFLRHWLRSLDDLPNLHVPLHMFEVSQMMSTGSSSTIPTTPSQAFFSFTVLTLISIVQRAKSCHDSNRSWKRQPAGLSVWQQEQITMFVAGWGVPSWTLNIHQLWANTSEGASIRSLRIAVRYVRNVLSQVRASLQSGPRRHHACCRCRCLWLCVGDPLFFFFFFFFFILH